MSDQASSAATATSMDDASSVTREALYELVWSKPMLEVATRFGVSSSYMARVCTRLRVPRPERGYWAKLSAGKKMARPPLPPARAGDELEWLGDGSIYSDEARLPKTIPIVSAPSVGKVSKSGTHPILQGVKGIFEAGRTPSGDYEVPYLRPSKRRLVDLTATRAGLDRTLAFANTFFQSLEAKGYGVALAPHGAHFTRQDLDEREIELKGNHYSNRWGPDRPTIVYIGALPFGLSIIEMSEVVPSIYVNGKYIPESEYVPPKRRNYFADTTWKSNRATASGRLKLRVYMPRNIDWAMQWQETKGQRLETLIPKIIEAIEQSVPQITLLLEEAARQMELRRREWEEQEARWAREKEERRIAENIEESKAELAQIINIWTEALHIERFLADVESRAHAYAPEIQQALLERAKLARELLGARNPLEAIQRWKAPHER